MVVFKRLGVKRPWVRPLNTQGSVQVLLLVIFFGMTMTGFGIWGFIRHWRFQVEKQLRLNQCVGEVALELRTSLNAIFVANRKIEKLRAAILAAELEPALIPPLRAALAGLVLQQNYYLMKWQWRSRKWLISKGCGEKQDSAFPLPSLDLVRPPPDLLGPQALRWKAMPVSEFFVQAQNSPRYAAARVFGDHLWSASWCPPRKGYLRGGL